ncbi:MULTISPECIES: hypothetical protein [Priestia]|uniref:hypothetical protein n=1 Tax=Priestia TaxID=2800373 RepID=UPI00081567D0|nr:MULTISPECIES: hypothetical protein [Priestia]SCC50777.1 hypothetical protein GA0061087_106617 [Priestia flexa]
MDELLERLKDQIENNFYNDETTVKACDLMELIYEYEIETGRRKRWNDERWD